MINAELNNSDIEILRRAVRDREREIEDLQTTPIKSFFENGQLENEIQGKRLVVRAYRHLIESYERRQSEGSAGFRFRAR